MESQNFGHKHPLLLMANEEAQSNQTEASPTHDDHYCSRYGEKMSSGPSFGCAECRFYLHKECAEAPSQIHHPFHRDHPLCLLPTPPAKSGYYKGFICNFCGEEGKKFDYHCSSCNIDLHIKCALFTLNLAEKRVGELKPIACRDPSISTELGNAKCFGCWEPLVACRDPSISTELGNAKCFGCWEPLVDSIYYSRDCGFNLHQKCADLPLQIDYPGHRKHPLILQFNSQIFTCVICQDTTIRIGFFYRCSLCNFGIHIACLSPPTIEDKGHRHPFTLFLRPFPFTCDACGIEGNRFPYMCSSCSLLVHKECISLPRTIKFMWHEHPISHTYFLPRHESKNWDCVVCLKGVNMEHGSYSCSNCHFVVHVNCVLKRKNWYYVIETDKQLGDILALLSDMNSFTVIERNKDGEATEIKHFSHVHNLMLSDKVVKDDKYCDGCMLSISDSFYYCSLCEIFFHKICAEFPKKKHDWFHFCQLPYILISGQFFKCSDCLYVSNGLAYKCERCETQMCMRCSNLLDTVTCQGHEHPLSFYVEYEGQCNACGENRRGAFKCKECNFAVGGDCIDLPCTIRHKCDEHLLTLTYHDDDTYSKRQFCDVCEEDRNPNLWFYHCAICDTCVHPRCVLGRGRYPYMKLGKRYEFKDHPHPLTLVKKMYYYPECSACDKHCLDLALECQEPTCGYIIHWDCFGSSSGLREY
ncbi:hypothetical protein PTKIN_Ptkin02bG0049100 [Pterospermum kingtungense]